ncbi:unnamed protein product [Cylicostephanus goldi]|uniref:Uncharacterized protein n=1 Tax=Cylicostephanus goldi TaxID=71465 RepID=A0A3P7MMU9_CYLGO|nr:unnamed protein product [Cylicostephanus goldi]
MTDQQQYEAEAELASSQGRPVTAAARKMERDQTRFRLPLHEPASIFWDETDDRFLVCHAQPTSQHVVGYFVYFSKHKIFSGIVQFSRTRVGVKISSNWRCSK